MLSRVRPASSRVRRSACPALRARAASRSRDARSADASWIVALSACCACVRPVSARAARSCTSPTAFAAVLSADDAHSGRGSGAGFAGSDASSDARLPVELASAFTYRAGANVTKRVVFSRTEEGDVDTAIEDVEGGGEGA